MLPLASSIPTLLLTTLSVLSTEVWWVDVNNGNCPGDGSREDPFCLIQDALDIAANGDEIRVAAGEYREELSLVGKRVAIIGAQEPSKTVLLPNGLRSILSIANCELVRISNLCLQDGDNPSTGGGALSVTGSEITCESVRFRRNRAYMLQSGGAVLARNATLSFCQCRFLENWSEIFGYGGAMAVYDSHLSLVGCAFESNQVRTGRYTGAGGAVAAFDSSVDICDSFFFENSVDGWDGRGGALYLSGDDAVTSVTRTRFVSNRTSTVGASSGGAISSSPSATATISLTRCLFEKNRVLVSASSAPARGGAVDFATRVESCVFIGNQAICWSQSLGEASGGAIESAREVSNSLIAQNAAEARGPITATARGGGIRFGGKISSCTIVDNRAVADLAEFEIVQEGGGIGSAQELWNSIVWGNSPEQLISAVDVAFSNVQDTAFGAGNISQDPKFSPNGEYLLTCKSPCIDSGRAALEPLPELDASGRNFRVIGSEIDMGANEFGMSVSPRWNPKTGRLSFELHARDRGHGAEGVVFLSLRAAPDAGGIPLPDSTGRSLGLVPDPTFHSWLALPPSYRSARLLGCEGQSTKAVEVPPHIPAGIEIYLAGMAIDKATFEIFGLTGVQSLVLE